jgi:hypothetical protein
MSLREGFLLLFVLIFLCSGCRERSKVAQASRELAARITQSAPQQSSTTNTIQIEDRRVYLDASLSMKGFVNPRNHSTFDELIDELGDALPGCGLYKYGQSGEQPPENPADLVKQVGFGLELHNPNFYNLRYNPDDRLIDTLTNEKRPVLSVLITDGVYSEPAGSTSPPVVNAIQRWLQNGGVLGIFALKSAFDGPFYTERGRQMLPKLSVEARPFYAFVFSPTASAVIDLKEKLQRRFPAIKTIFFSNEAITCESALNERLKNTYSYKKPPETPYRWQMFDPEIFSQHNPAAIGIEIKCALDPAYPVSELNFTLITEYYRWQKGKFQKVDSTPTGFRSDPLLNNGTNNQSASATSNMQSNLVVYLPRDNGGDYGFYYFKLTAVPKELHEDLKEFSTRDDREPKDAGKTFRFRELVSAIAEVHFKTNMASRTSPSVFMTIDNH